MQPLRDANLRKANGRAARRCAELVVRERDVTRDERRAVSACKQRLSQVTAAKIPAGCLVLKRNLAPRLQMNRPRRLHA